MRSLQRRLRNGGRGTRRLLIELEEVFGERGSLLPPGMRDLRNEGFVAYTCDSGCQSLWTAVSGVPDNSLQTPDASCTDCALDDGVVSQSPIKLHGLPRVLRVSTNLIENYDSVIGLRTHETPSYSLSTLRHPSPRQRRLFYAPQILQMTYLNSTNGSAYLFTYTTIRFPYPQLKFVPTNSIFPGKFMQQSRILHIHPNVVQQADL